MFVYMLCCVCMCAHVFDYQGIVWTCGCLFDRSLYNACHMTIFSDKIVIEDQESIITKSRIAPAR